MMKYLKKYQLYESPTWTSGDGEKQTRKDIIENVNDILIELKDDGWYINVEYVGRSYHNKENYISISISKTSEIKHRFKFSDISDEVLRIVDIYKDKYKLELRYHEIDESRVLTKQVAWWDSESIYEDEFKQKEILGFYININL